MKHVICFGNPLHGDDGFGHAVYRALSRQLGDSDLIRIYDAGTAGLNALPLFEGCDSAILVDAMHNGGNCQPGRLVFTDDDTVLEGFQATEALSNHGNGIDYLLQAVRSLYHEAPKVSLLLVEAHRAETFNLNLSEPVQQAIEPALSIIYQHLGVSGYE